MRQANIEAHLRELVAKWIQAYERRDLTKIKEIFRDSKATFHYGTGVDEKIEGLDGMRKQLERDWLQSEKGQLELVDFRFECFEDRFAWVVSEIIPTITIAGKTYSLPILRGTLVCIFEDGVWKVAHTHASWPYQEQKEGQSFPG